VHWRTAAKGDTPLIRGFTYDEKLRLPVRHIGLAFNDATYGLRSGEPRLQCPQQAGIG
jgi:hypothetical protein